LFASLAGRSISVAVKGLNAIVGSDPDRVPDRVGIFDRAGQLRMVSEKKDTN
jgi:hypothetical protein